MAQGTSGLYFKGVGKGYESKYNSQKNYKASRVITAVLSLNSSYHDTSTRENNEMCLNS